MVSRFGLEHHLELEDNQEFSFDLINQVTFQVGADGGSILGDAGGDSGTINTDLFRYNFRHHQGVPETSYQLSCPSCTCQPAYQPTRLPRCQPSWHPRQFPRRQPR